MLAKVGDRTEQVSFPFFPLICYPFLLHSSLALCRTVNMCKCLFLWYGSRSSMALHLLEELRTFSGLLSPITLDCYHFAEDHSHRQSILKEESGVYVLVNSAHHAP